MPDMQKLQEKKEKIILVINSIGPSYPSRIARETGIDPLFVSAFLAELVSDKKLKVSNMKVGSSPLYLIEGQEKDLEKFEQYLNNKEREAFIILKESGVLEDGKQEPAIRVALRKIKDFAIPLNVKFGEEAKIFWKFFSLSEEEVKSKIQDLLNLKKQQTKSKNLFPQQEEKEKNEKPLPIKEKTLVLKDKPKKQQKEFEFTNFVKKYLTEKNIEILKEIESKKKEFSSKVRIDTFFGKQEYYLVAKEKKKISSDDLVIALQKAQAEKMPALFISSGDLDKKAQEHLKEWTNLVKFEKIKI